MRKLLGPSYCLGPNYWIRMAERCYYWHQDEPHMRWEKLMYFYLFKHYGYKE